MGPFWLNIVYDSSLWFHKINQMIFRIDQHQEKKAAGITSQLYIFPVIFLGISTPHMQ